MHFAPAEQARRFLADNPDIDLIELFILDANGVPRGKLLHRDELLAVFETGRPLPSTILGLTLNGDDVENSGLVWDVGDIDCRAYPLQGSLVRLPWRRVPTAAVQVSMHPSEGMPASIADPRHVLLRTIDALKADGYYPVMACELEFYLLDQKPDAQGRPQPALDNDGGRPRTTQVYGLRELEQIEPFLADLYAACKARASRHARRSPNMPRARSKSPWSMAMRWRRWIRPCVINAWSKASPTPTACRPASWPSRSPSWPAPACTCT